MKRVKKFRIVRGKRIFYIEEYKRYWISIFNGWSKLGSEMPSGSSSMTDTYVFYAHEFMSEKEAKNYLERKYDNYELV
jgi:hypothetical protein